MLIIGSRRIAVAMLAAALLPRSAAFAQTPLTLAEAMRLARTGSAAARSQAAAIEEAAERIRQARSGYLPRLDVTESVQRGDHPVFVFSSLLAQRRFTADNFAIDQLNDPSPLTNVRTGVAVEQPVFNGGLTRLAVQGAVIQRDIAAAGRDAAGQDLALGAARAYVRVLQLESTVKATQAAVEAADSDLARARARRDVQLVTDADVLDVEVHLADMRQRQLAASADLAVARMELNEVIGAPLDAAPTLVPPDAPPPAPAVDALIRAARTARPHAREAGLRSALAANARRAAQAAFLPRLGVVGGWELNGDRFADQRSSWTVGAQVQLNLFRGFGDAARIAEARHAEVRAEAERERVERGIEVEVRAAIARLEAARGREDVGRAALMQARESQRIVRDRYESGLATIGDVLRAAGAVLDAESRAVAAQMDVVVQAVALDRAAGRL